MRRVYSPAFSFGVTLRRSFAILLTAAIRSAICSIVKPSGKMILSGFGGGTTTGAGGGGRLAQRAERERAEQADERDRSDEPDEREHAPRAQLPAARARAPADRWDYLLAHARYEESRWAAARASSGVSPPRVRRERS